MLYRCSECNGLVEHWVQWGSGHNPIFEIYHCTKCGIDKHIPQRDEEVVIVNMLPDELQ